MSIGDTVHGFPQKPQPEQRNGAAVAHEPASLADDAHGVTGADGASQTDPIVKGKPDPLGDEVVKIYVRTDSFVIYSVSDQAGDFLKLRNYLLGDYERSRALRGKAAPITGLVARISDVVCSMKPRRRASDQRRFEYDGLRERVLDLIAKARQQCFEGEGKEAKTLLQEVLAEVESRRDSRNRMRYIMANAVALTLILGLWLFDHAATGPAQGMLTGVFGTLPGGVAVIDVLALGAIGAFFAVSFDIKAVKVSHAITLPEMLYAGFVRVPIGVIAAAVVIMLIAGQWILASISDEARTWSLCLFGFLAGFSEYFVPNALKKVEDGIEVARPDAVRTAPEG